MVNRASSKHLVLEFFRHVLVAREDPQTILFLVANDREHFIIRSVDPIGSKQIVYEFDAESETVVVSRLLRCDPGDRVDDSPTTHAIVVDDETRPARV